MGRAILIGVIILTVTFTAITVGVQKRVSNIPDQITESIDFMNSKNLRDFALTYSLKKAYELDDNEDWHLAGFLRERLNVDFSDKLSDFFGGTIDSIRYTALNPAGDSIRISSFITQHIGKGVKAFETEAMVKFEIEEHPKSEIFGFDFDESDPNLVFDGSNNNNNGILGNGVTNYKPTRTVGKNGSALDFDGDNDYVYVGDELIEPDGDELTVGTWVNFSNTNTDWGMLAAEKKSNSDHNPIWSVRARKIAGIKIFGIVLVPTTIKVAFDIYNGGGSYGYTEVDISKNEYEININSWHYVVATYREVGDATALISISIADLPNDNKRTKLTTKWQGRTDESYVTIGGDVNQTTYTSFLSTLLGSLFTRLNCTDAKMDEVKILNEALDDDDIQDLVSLGGIKDLRLAYWIQ
ncbi:MAG TPA: hypothetical protein PLS75_03770 [Candidatus Marinimicrobia bacterium]|nr:hypothetical protein [Candidatus Neomarinimicrobiota bacterium]